MNYFCDVHLQSRKDEEKRIFIVLDNENISDKELPNLTKSILIENSQYKDFTLKYKPKIVVADYKVYSTEEEIFASSQDEVFEELIQHEKVNFIGESEIQVDCAKDKNVKKRRKKKTSPALKFGIAGGVLVLGVVAFGFGNIMGKSKANVETEEVTNVIASEDGMIIPEQAEISADAEQITISIDRSYSAVPTEDLQIKGEVIDGVAQITLPEFDKTDFLLTFRAIHGDFPQIRTARKLSITAEVHIVFQRIQNFTVCL